MSGHKDKSSKVVLIVLRPLSSRSALDHPNPYWMSESQVGSAFNQQEWTSHKWMIEHGIGAEILRELWQFQLPETGKLLKLICQLQAENAKLMREKYKMPRNARNPFESETR